MCEFNERVKWKTYGSMLSQYNSSFSLYRLVTAGSMVFKYCRISLILYLSNRNDLVWCNLLWSALDPFSTVLYAKPFFTQNRASLMTSQPMVKKRESRGKKNSKSAIYIKEIVIYRSVQTESHKLIWTDCKNYSYGGLFFCKNKIFRTSKIGRVVDKK